MQYYFLDSRVSIVAMCLPTARTKINFNITSLRCFVSKLKHCPLKIRPTFEAAETGMQYTNCFAVERMKLITAQALMLPCGLQQSFGRSFQIFSEKWRDSAANAPLGVEIRQD
jgi:hypothetical protein